ncbi:MAG: phage holin family protein [Acidobacteriota bacterium]
MPKWLLRWILNILAIMATAYLIPNFDVKSWWAAIVGSIVLAILNALVRPIIILFTLPINLLTLGLFTLVINGFILWITARVVDGFVIGGFGTAIIAALVLTIVSSIVNWFVED